MQVWLKVKGIVMQVWLKVKTFATTHSTEFQIFFQRQVQVKRCGFKVKGKRNCD